MDFDFVHFISTYTGENEAIFWSHVLRDAGARAEGVMITPSIRERLSVMPVTEAQGLQGLGDTAVDAAAANVEGFPET